MGVNHQEKFCSGPERFGKTFLCNVIQRPIKNLLRRTALNNVAGMLNVNRVRHVPWLAATKAVSKAVRPARGREGVGEGREREAR